MDKKEIKNLIGVDNPVIFEIGCADGIDTMEFINTFGDNMKLYCFEPDNRNANVFLNGGDRPLDKNFKSGIARHNLIFEKKAIGNIDGIVEFNQSSTIYSSSLKKPTDEISKEWPQITFGASIKANSVKLDTYVKEHNIEFINFIWADVQGAEDLMIEGGKDTFENKVKYLYTEYSNKEYYENALNKDSILEKLGDSWVIIKDYGADVLLKNTKL